MRGSLPANELIHTEELLDLLWVLHVMMNWQEKLSPGIIPPTSEKSSVTKKINLSYRRGEDGCAGMNRFGAGLCILTIALFYPLHPSRVRLLGSLYPGVKTPGFTTKLLQGLDFIKLSFLQNMMRHSRLGQAKRTQPTYAYHPDLL